MKREKLEELKAACDAAAHARDLARKDYNVARDALIGTPAYFDNKDTADVWNTYITADASFYEAWHDYVAEQDKIEVEINKMKTENKLKELKAAAWDTDVAYEAAISSRNAAWDAYIAADIVLTAARDAFKQAGNAANAYEAGEYETNPYEAEDK